MSKYIKVEGCHNCGNKEETDSENIIYCEHPKTSAIYNVLLYVQSEIIAPECPLPDMETMEFVKSQLKIAEWQIKELLRK